MAHLLHTRSDLWLRGWPHHLATLDTLEEEAADVQVQLIEHREEISLCRSHKDCGNVWVEAKQSHCQHCWIFVVGVFWSLPYDVIVALSTRKPWEIVPASGNKVFIVDCGFSCGVHCPLDLERTFLTSLRASSGLVGLFPFVSFEFRLPSVGEAWVPPKHFICSQGEKDLCVGHWRRLSRNQTTVYTSWSYSFFNRVFLWS